MKTCILIKKYSYFVSSRNLFVWHKGHRGVIHEWRHTNFQICSALSLFSSMLSLTTLTNLAHQNIEVTPCGFCHTEIIRNRYKIVKSFKENIWRKYFWNKTNFSSSIFVGNTHRQILQVFKEKKFYDVTTRTSWRHIKDKDDVTFFW